MTRMYDRSSALFRKLTPRLSADAIYTADMMLFTGELLEFVDGITGFLFLWKCPITPDEFDDLRDILYACPFPVRFGRFVNNRDEVLAGLVVREGPIEGPPFAVVGAGLPHFDALEGVSEEGMCDLGSIDIHRRGVSVQSFDWLLLKWANSILELRSTTSTEIRDIMNVDDLIFTLGRRDLIEQTIPRLTGQLRTAVERWVAAYDREYLSSTVEDPRDWVAYKAKGRSGEAWWWHRIPDCGPVAEEYAAFMARFEEWKRARAAEGDSH